jgi:hypothetical protein
VSLGEVITRFNENLAGRIGGPLSLRFILQPTVATLLAVRAGLRDARAGKPPFLWTVVTDPTARQELLREGWKDIAKVFTLAIVLDVVYQLIVLKWIHPLETLVVAFVLAALPYAIVRGPVTRLARKRS